MALLDYSTCSENSRYKFISDDGKYGVVDQLIGTTPKSYNGR
jgi:hypothetical protein